MGCACHKVGFPVSVVKPLFYHSRTLFNTDTVLNPSASILTSESLPAFLSALTQVLVKRATPAMVFIDVLVDPLMAHRLFALAAHHPSDLLWTQIIPQVCFYFGLHHRGELASPATGETPIFGFALRLFVSVAALSAVAPYLTAYRAGIAPKALGYPRLIISLFTHALYRVAFLLS